MESTPCADLQNAVGRYEAETDLGKLAVMFGVEGALQFTEQVQSDDEQVESNKI